jgi:hypothetical protein
MQRIATILLASVVVAAPVALGAVHTPVVAGLLAGLVLAAIAGEVWPTDEQGGVWLSLPGLVFFALAAWSGFQLLPLPVGLLEVVQSEGARIYTTGWQLVFPDTPVSWHPSSMDPAATADRGLRWLALGMAALVAANLAEKRRWRAIYLTILCAGVVTLGVGTASFVLDPKSFFGLYEPTISFRGPSPFVSTNHAASFYALCGVVGFGGLALRRESHPIEASIAGALGLLFIALAAVHDSDAVMAGLGLAVVVFGVGLAVRTQGVGRLRVVLSEYSGRFAYGITAGLCVLVLAWWVGALDVISGIVMSPLEDSESALNRTEIALAALRGSADYLWVGAGGGAVDVTVGRYIDWSALRPASIPVVENDPAEWLLTYGWFAGGAAALALLASGGFTLRRLVRSSRGERWVMASAVWVLGFVIALFHFPFFALGVSLPLVAAFDGVTSPRRPPESRGFSRSGHLGLPSWVRKALIVATIAGGAAFLLIKAQWTVSFDAEPAVLVKSRPADGRVFAELSSRVMFDDPDRAVELARWSAELDRAGDARLFFARTLGKTGSDEESAQVYAELLSSPVQAGLVRYEWLVRDLERPADRATALSRATGARIGGAIRVVGKMEGPEAATDLVLELSDLRGDDPALHRAAIDTFISLGALDLAELWSSAVNQRGVFDDGVPIGPELMARVALVQGDTESARTIAAAALQREKPGQRIALTYLGVTPDVAEASAEAAEAVERAADLACHSPLPAHRRKACWLAEAWIAEHGGELDDAELIFQRIASRLDAPTFLAHFWVRHGRCLDLQRFLESMGEDGKRKAVARVAQKCRS